MEPNPQKAKQDMFITDDATYTALPWDTLEAMIQGTSSIDLKSMPMQTREEAYQFVLRYGYDLDNESDALEVQEILLQAIQFIENYLLQNPEIDWQAVGEATTSTSKIPAHLTQTLDILDLIMISSTAHDSDRHWACAILKVVHTIAHIQNGPYWHQFEEARKQILSAFDDILTPLGEENGVLLGKIGGSLLELWGFETKDQKSRESILVKLLCKKEHVAESIWDLIGVRLITQTPADALLAVNILREQKVLVFPNIIPSRSRNTLLDLDKFRHAYEAAFQSLERGKLSQDEFDDLIHHLDVMPFVDPNDEFRHAHNPSTSKAYRSLHITSRQLIRAQTAYGEQRFFFPYEIQILDKASFLESKLGNSAHSLYKQKQMIAARRRVLGLLLK